MGVGAGTAYAQPAPAQDGVGYQAHIDGRSVVTVLDAGGFHVTSDGRFVEIRNDAGQVIQTLPLTYRLGDREFSIAPVVEGRQLTLTPETDPAKATMADVAGRPCRRCPSTLRCSTNWPRAWTRRSRWARRSAPSSGLLPAA